MKLAPEGKDTIEKVRLIAGCSFDQCKDIFESLVTFLILNFLEKKSTHIPYLGEINLTHTNDVITSSGKIANISLSYTPDINIQRIIGQIADGDETEIEKLFITKIKDELEEIASDACKIS